MRLERSACGPHLFMETAVGEKCRGRPFRTIRDSFVDDPKLMTKDLDKRSSTHAWTGHAKVETEWINFIKRKENRERGNFSDGNDAHNDEEEDEPSPAPTPAII